MEHCNRYYTQEEPDAEMPECCGMDTQTLTILHRKKEPVSFFGSVVANFVYLGAHNGDIISALPKPS